MSGLMDGTAVAPMSVDETAVAPTPLQSSAIESFQTQSEGCYYRCGDCGFVNQLKLQDPIRCRQCGFRVLYKIRTSRMIQFEAR